VAQGKRASHIGVEILPVTLRNGRLRRIFRTWGRGSGGGAYIKIYKRLSPRRKASSLVRGGNMSRGESWSSYISKKKIRVHARAARGRGGENCARKKGGFSGWG